MKKPCTKIRTVHNTVLMSQSDKSYSKTLLPVKSYIKVVPYDVAKKTNKKKTCS